MSKLSMVCASLLCVVAFTAMTSAAEAEPYWTSNGSVLAAGVPVTVNTSATMTINALGSVIKCKLTDSEEIENPVGGFAGVDELLSFTLTNCKPSPKPGPCPALTTLEVSANPPLNTELIDEPPIRDVIEGMTLNIECSHVLKESFTGNLKPELEGGLLNFGAGSGSLENPITKKTATLTGFDKFVGIGKKEKIGGEDVEYFPHWYSNGKRIAEGLNETVTSKGVITSTIPGSTLTCTVIDVEKVENPVGGGSGTDVMTAYEPGKCVLTPACPVGTKLVVKATPPWPSELIAGTPIRDELKGVSIELSCVGGGGFGPIVYTGTLTPEVAATSALVFGPGSGSLTAPGPIVATVAGTDVLTGPPGDTKVTARLP